MKLKLTNTNIKTLCTQIKDYKVWDTEISGFFLKVRSSGRMTYGIYYRHDGRGREYTIGKHGNLTLKQAKDLARDALGQVARGVDVQGEKTLSKSQSKREEAALLGNFIEQQYTPWVMREHKDGKSTLAMIKRNFGQWYDKPMVDLNKWLVTCWRTKKLGTGLKPATMNRNLSCLKAALSKAVEWDVLDAHPLARMKPLKENTDPNVRYLNHAEESRLRKTLVDRDIRFRQSRTNHNVWLLERGYSVVPEIGHDQFGDHLHPMVLLTINTGLRRGEVFNLRWDDVSLDTANPMLTVRAAATKSAKTRHIPLNYEALEALRRWKTIHIGSGLIFPAKGGGRLDNISSSWSSVLKEAKIIGFRFHDLRHHFASRLVTKGVDLNTVRELLGHHDIKMTLRYAHLAPEHKAKAVALLLA